MYQIVTGLVALSNTHFMITYFLWVKSAGMA